MPVNDLRYRVKNIIIQLLDIGCNDEDIKKFWDECIDEAKKEYQTELDKATTS